MANVSPWAAAFKSNAKLEEEWPGIDKHLKRGNKHSSGDILPTYVSNTPQQSSHNSISDRFSNLQITPNKTIYDQTHDSRTRDEILLDRKFRKNAQKKEREQLKIEKRLVEIRAPKGSKITVIDRVKADNILNSTLHLLSSESQQADGNGKRNKPRRPINLAEFVDQCPLQLPTLDAKPENHKKELPLPKGKVREVPKLKRSSELKKNILLSRNIRRENWASKEPFEKIEDTSSSNDSEIECGKNIVAIPQTIERMNEHSEFSRKFRPYCDNKITKELCEVTENLLRDIFRFQDRAYNKNQIKARAHKRLVVGFKETQRQLDIGKIKLIVIAPDLEPTATNDFGGRCIHLV